MMKRLAVWRRSPHGSRLGFTTFVTALCLVAWGTGSNARANDYPEAVSSWTSYTDVADWLDSNFDFDKKRQGLIQKRLRSQGPDGLLVRAPATLYDAPKGYCADSANFALDALQRIDPAYDPQWIFIKNAAGPPNHWVTGFHVDGKLYVMDYGTGKKWSDMKGVHGPYDTLEDYAAYLSSLNMPKFGVGEVRWRDMPGQED